jgi:ABC-2 type transport system ATP-binding protein
MTEEAPFSPESGQDSTETGYQKFIQQKVEALNTPEYHDVYAWYKERVEAMPEMETSPAPLTDGDKWKYTETEDGEIDEIRSGFFSMEGRAVKTPTFSWNQPGIIGLLGPNGAGKSTLINILAGIVNRSGGECQVLGYDVTRDFRWTRQLLGVVPQEVSFEMMMTVEETLVNQSGYFGLLNNSAKINELLETFHLSDKRKSNTRFLSGGMKRRLLVCKALVHDPRIIILDEPTAGVDVELRQELWEYIKKLNARGRTILLTTHYIDEAQALCKKIAIINHGQLIRFEEKTKLMQQIQEKKLRAVFKPGGYRISNH